jgi:hypothetical protein
VIVGLDTASNRWHAVGQDDLVGYCSELKGVAWTRGRDAPDRRRSEMTRAFRGWLHLSLTGADRLEIWCEEPLALQNGKTTRLLSLAAGALWDVADPVTRISWEWVDVSHWKAVIVGNGNADKERIRAFVLDRDPDLVRWDDEPDLYDAYCLRLYGELVEERGGERPLLVSKKRKKKE